MNILFVDQFSDPGGAQLCLQDLMPEILRRGWKPRMMMPGSGEVVTWSREWGIPVDTLPLTAYTNGPKTAHDVLRFGLDAPRMAATIRAALKRHRTDLLYVNGPRVLPAAMGSSCPVMFHAHTRVTGVFARKLVQWSLRRTRATVIAASQFAANACRGFAAGPVHVVYNGVADLNRGLRSFGGRPARIGIIGRIAPEKGQLDFVRAARLIAAEHPGARFIVYGDRLFSEAAYDHSVRREAKETPVEFRGWVADVPSAMHDLDVVAVPSGPVEATPRVVLEAFSCGTPVVAYPSGGIPELVTHGRTGILTESAAPYSLARSISALLAEPNRMQALAAAGRQEWRRRFRVETFRTSICDLLERTAGFRGVVADLAPARNWL